MVLLSTSIIKISTDDLELINALP